MAEMILGPSTACGQHNSIDCLYSPPCDDHRQRHWTAARLVEQLHEEVYGATWARPDSPAETWAILLREVRRKFRPVDNTTD